MLSSMHVGNSVLTYDLTGRKMKFNSFNVSNTKSAITQFLLPFLYAQFGHQLLQLKLQCLFLPNRYKYVKFALNILDNSN